MPLIKFSLKNVFGPALGLMVVLTSPIVYGQSMPDGNVPYEGITSYIFSPMAITVILVLALIAQIAYWYHNRSATAKPQVAAMAHQPVEAAKRRFDQGSMSKLLKASASATGKTRSLEEAIRLSQLTQPVLPARPANVHIDEVESVDSETEFASEGASQPTTPTNAEVTDDIIDDLSVVEAEPDTDDLEDGLEPDALK